jgi:hypothetical protein
MQMQMNNLQNQRKARLSKPAVFPSKFIDDGNTQLWEILHIVWKEKARGVKIKRVKSLHMAPLLSHDGNKAHPIPHIPLLSYDGEHDPKWRTMGEIPNNLILPRQAMNFGFQNVGRGIIYGRPTPLVGFHRDHAAAVQEAGELEVRVVGDAQLTHLDLDPLHAVGRPDADVKFRVDSRQKLMQEPGGKLRL